MKSSINQHSKENVLFLAVVLTGGLAAEFQTLRQHYHTLAERITPPHVTIVRSFRLGGLATPKNEADTLALLQAVQSQIRPFELAINGVGEFRQPRRVIYLRVEPLPGLLAARQKLLEVINFDDQRPYTPHLTLAKDLDLDEHNVLMSQLQQSERPANRWSITVRKISIMQRVQPADRVWRCIYQIELQ